MSAAGISSVVSSEVGSHGTVVRLVEQASPSNDTRRLVGLVEQSLRQWGHWKNALVQGDITLLMCMFFVAF